MAAEAPKVFVIQVSHDGTSRSIAIQSGFSTDSLFQLLQVVFECKGNILGFIGPNGLVIPLSVACQSPDILVGTSWSLILSKDTLSNGPSSVANSKSNVDGLGSGMSVGDKTDSDFAKQIEIRASKALDDANAILSMANSRVSPLKTDKGQSQISTEGSSRIGHEEEDNNEEDGNFKTGNDEYTLEFEYIVFSMLQNNIITSSDAASLLQMIHDENQLVYAAFELYLSDQNLESLHKTLLDCVKLDARKRAVEFKEKQYEMQEYASRRASREASAAPQSASSSEFASGRSQSYQGAPQKHSPGKQQSQSPEASNKPSMSSNLFSRTEQTSEQRYHDTSRQTPDATKAAVITEKARLLESSVLILLKRKLISESDADNLINKISSGDEYINLAIDKLAIDKDIESFLENIAFYATSINADNDDEDDDDDEEDDEEEDDDNDDDKVNNPEYNLSRKELNEFIKGVTSTATSSSVRNNDDDSDDGSDESSTSSADSTTDKKLNSDETIVVRIATRQVIFDLKDRGKIDTEGASALLTLLHNWDSRILAAYNKYKSSLNRDEFCKTLELMSKPEISRNRSEKMMRANLDSEELDTLDREANKWLNDDNSDDDDDESENEGSEDGDESDDDKSEDDIFRSRAPISSSMSETDKKSAVKLLKEAGAINDVQFQYLSYLVENNNSTVDSLFLDYENSRDASTLVTMFKSVCQLGVERFTKYYLEGEDDDDDDDDDDESDNESDDESDDNNDTKHSNSNSYSTKAASATSSATNQDISRMFEAVIEDMGLSEIEVSALRVALGGKDPEIQRALSEFKLDLDDSLLKVRLREISKRIILTCLEENDISSTLMGGLGRSNSAANNYYDNVDDDDDDIPEDSYASHDYGEKYGDFDANDGFNRDFSDSNIDAYMKSFRERYNLDDNFEKDENDDDEDEDDDEDNADDNDEEESEEEDDYDFDAEYAKIIENRQPSSSVDQKHNFTEIAVNPNKSNEQKSSSDDEDDDEDDVDSNSGPISAQESRKHLFPILMEELVAGGIVSKSQGKVILKEFNSGNKSIQAAMDVYDENSDMEALVDVFQRVLIDVVE